MNKLAGFVLLSGALLSACATGPNHLAPDPVALGVPDRWTGPDRGDVADSQTPDAWWTQFDDPQLTRYVEAALSGNLDIAQALARLRQAREFVTQARASYLPSIDGAAGVGRNLDSGARDRSSFSVGADAAWEADLFGGISRSVEAARADAAAAGFDLATVRVSIAAETANSYISARTAQARLAIARDTLGTQDDNLQIAQWRVQAGLVSTLDQEQARAQRAQTAALIPTLEANLANAVNRLAVLTGRAPGAINAEIAAEAPIPQGPASIAVGIPADTLRQRPDVRASERALAAATARIGVAQSLLYPALRLTGNIGTGALSLGGLGDVVTGGLFAGVAQTIFDGGRLRAQVRSARAAADGAFAAYRQTVLTGLEDVENGLVARDAAERREVELGVALDAASNAALLARSQYRAGLSDFQTLLEAERSLLSARDGLINAGADRALSLVQLYRALGGGWQSLAPIQTETP
jgi:NodT family efflux transporter outer membrane factor (OMF) lipoprotein